MLIDDFTGPGLRSALGTPWRLVTDQVMGGVSEGRLGAETHGSQPCLRLSGQVRLDNSGGFIQASLELAPSGVLDGSSFAGVRLLVRGNGARYGLHLKTADLTFPWQSYRASFVATPAWTEVEVPFTDLVPYRTRAPFDPRRLVRLGVLAIGQAYDADLCVGRVALYRHSPTDPS